MVYINTVYIYIYAVRYILARSPRIALRAGSDTLYAAVSNHTGNGDHEVIFLCEKHRNAQIFFERFDKRI